MYTVRRYRTITGQLTDLRARYEADSKAVHRMECSGARSLYKTRSASQQGWLHNGQKNRTASIFRGGVLHLHDRMLNKLNELSDSRNATDPRSVSGWYYIAGDTLRHHANGSGSHDGAPVTWAYGLPCPAMVSPNATLAQRRQTVVPGWSPYMSARISGFRPAQITYQV